jgi:RNA polymerase primary sigma factor
MDHVDRRPHGGWDERRFQLVLAAQRRENGKREELIDEFMPLVGGVARLYRGSSAVNRTELMQQGVVGLLEALERYDPELGTPFWAYASWWVRQAMQQLVAQLGRPVVLSDRALRELARLAAEQRRFVQEHAREPTLCELAEAAEMPVAHLQRLQVANRQARGLEEPLGGDPGSSTFADVLCDPEAEDPYERVPQRATADQVRFLLDTLDDRERAIVRGRFGLDCPQSTLRELGSRLGVSAERVRQIEQRALDKLQIQSCAVSPSSDCSRGMSRRVT